MIDNANPQKNPITTILGLVMSLISLLIWVAPMFVEVKKDYTTMWYIPTGILVSGILLIGAPDKLFSGLGKVVDKQSDKL